MLLKLIFASHSTVISNMWMDCKYCENSLWLMVVAAAAKSIFIMRKFEYVTNLAAVCPARGSGGWYFGNSATKISRNATICFVIYCPSVTTLTLLNWFLWNVIIWGVYRNCWQSECCKEQQKLNRYSDWAIANSCFRFLAGTRNLSCLRNVQTVSNAPPDHLFRGYRALFPLESIGRNVKLTLRMSGVVALP